MMGRSCSEDQVITKHNHGLVTNASAKSSDDGTTSAAHCSIREVSLDNSSEDHNSKNHRTSDRMDKNQIDGCIQMRKKVPKHLMIESSSSNSSSATAVSCRSKKNKKNKKSSKDLSVDAEPSSSVDEKDNNKPSWLINSVDSIPPKRSDQAYEGVVNNKSLDGYGSRDECSNMSSRKQQQFTVKETEEQSQESCLRQMRRPKEVSAMISSKSITVASADLSQDVLDFDLNVDFEANEREKNPWHPSFIDQSAAADAARSHASEPVAVMAKVAVPNGLPSSPLQFDGQLAWRSSPTTSAFRPTTLLSNHSDGNLKNSSKNNKIRTNTDHGFDLNIAADSPPNEFESSAITTDFCSSGKCSSVEAKSPRKIAQKLSLDLNYGDDQQGSRHQSFLKLQMGGGFDLNENLMPSSAAGTCTDVYHQSAVKIENHQVKLHSSSTRGTTTSYKEGLGPGSGQGQFHMGLPSRPTYWVDMGSIPSFAQNLQGQSYVVDSGPNFFPPSDSQQRQGSVVGPVQSKVAFAPAPQPGFYVTTPNALPSYYPCSPNMFAPWTGQPGLTNFVPQLANGGQVHTPTTYQTGPPNIHVFESSHVSQGLYSSVIIGGQMGIAAGCYPYSGTGGMVSSDKDICNTGNGNANEHVFRGSGNLVPHIVEKTSQVPQYMGASPPPPTASSVKRREPGGGWDSFQQQLNCRRMTAWK